MELSHLDIAKALHVCSRCTEFRGCLTAVRNLRAEHELTAYGTRKMMWQAADLVSEQTATLLATARALLKIRCTCGVLDGAR